MLGSHFPGTSSPGTHLCCLALSLMCCRPGTDTGLAMAVSVSLFASLACKRLDIARHRAMGAMICLVPDVLWTWHWHRPGDGSVCSILLAGMLDTAASGVELHRSTLRHGCNALLCLCCDVDPALALAWRRQCLLSFPRYHARCSSEWHRIYAVTDAATTTVNTPPLLLVRRPLPAPRRLCALLNALPPTPAPLPLVR